MQWRIDPAHIGFRSLLFAPRIATFSGSSSDTPCVTIRIATTTPSDTSGIRFPIRWPRVTSSDTPGVPRGSITSTATSDTSRVIDASVSTSNAPRASHLKTLRAAESRNYSMHYLVGEAPPER